MVTMEDSSTTTQSNQEQSSSVAIDGQQVQVGRDVAGGDITTTIGRDSAGRDIVTTAGRDVVGHDVVSTTTITHTGLSAAEVQRLVITVGILVFVTAACFFSGGVAVGGTAIAALNRPVGKSVAMADAMKDKLDKVVALDSGQELDLAFTEAELNSYVWHDLGPQIGLEDAQARFLESGHFVVGGYWEDLGNSHIVATFRLQEGDMPIKLESAAMQVLPLGASSFGWVAIPTQVLQPLQDRLNRELDNVELGPISSRFRVPEPPPPGGPDIQVGEVVEWSMPVTRP
jgi:hypothetical protein